MLIGDVARRSGVSARMLRHYDTLGLVRPTGRTQGGYRTYSDQDIRRIFHVESLRSLGLSLREVAAALDDPAFTPAYLVDDLIRQTRERIAAETALLTRLRRISAAEPDDWQVVLQTVALLHALGSQNPGKRQRAALSSTHDGPLPADALAEAVLHEADTNVAGALRWALAQNGVSALPALGKALHSPVGEVRGRAVLSIAEIQGSEATALLREALSDSDVEVRRRAALALGTRQVPEAIPTLVDMIVEAANDVDATDALGALARDPARAEQIATRLIDLLTHHTTDAPARRRLTQALADIPGAIATQALNRLTHDDDRAVALTATYTLTLRSSADDRQGVSPRQSHIVSEPGLGP
ncbi:HEAT repeat domain-containing protein [Streptomyces kanamyceticus]|uniref:MerR family transcriptional regulator n=1 Tax=Streptomyces kanamyceticus TaxID=1967 RepID=A0A5J6GSX9_STRKN|nr:HEAT repeat domain-containing protein [Streptomyces kanamyceticus]QEU96868.1 MerR family transcriptional regulator [Streptomyces kanamyceticus]